MAHFAKLGPQNIVERVEVISNDVAPTEEAGINFLQSLYGQEGVWKKTSYNTSGGVHKLGGTPFRKNYAGVGFTYDEDRDAFISPKPFNSWILNETTCDWEAPIAYPTDGQNYKWNETNLTWDLIE